MKSLFLCAVSLLSGADLVLYNGRITTLDPARPQATAISITGGRITNIGTDGQINRDIKPGVKAIDLGGRLVTPGLIEGHGHLVGLGQSKMTLNLRDTRNWDRIVAMVAAAAKEAKPGEWIVGRGWHQEKWDRKPSPEVLGFPVHESLSKAAPNNPVLLTHASGHASFANAAALARAGITGATADPNGGQILKDSAGNPTGLLNESAQGLVSRAMEADLARRPQSERDAEASRVLDLAFQEMVAKGITTFHDAGASFETVERLKARASAGTLPVRLYVMLGGSGREIIANANKYRLLNYGDDHLTVRAIKQYMDGALGSRGAWLLAPYSDLPTSSGLPTGDLKELEDVAAFAIENNFQLAIHAIGDRANREVLNLYQRTFEAHSAGAGNRDTLRWRIEHAQHIDPADIPRFAQLGVIASMQAIHATSDAVMVLPRLGPKRAEEGAYIWKSLINAGAHVTNGTDVPVEDIDPIANYYASVTRSIGGGKTFYPAQKLTRIEALRAYTTENAYAAFEDTNKGILRVGMLGDVTVFSKNILTVPDDEIPSAVIDMTVIGGRVAFERPIKPARKQ